MNLYSYTTCCQAAISAAQRVRQPAAIRSAHHARSILSALDAMAPWVIGGPEPEELHAEPDAPTPERDALKQRTSAERTADILAALTDEPISGRELADRARVNHNHIAGYVAPLILEGKVLRIVRNERVHYRKSETWQAR